MYVYTQHIFICASMCGAEFKPARCCYCLIYSLMSLLVHYTFSLSREKREGERDRQRESSRASSLLLFLYGHLSLSVSEKNYRRATKSGAHTSKVNEFSVSPAQKRK